MFDSTLRVINFQDKNIDTFDQILVDEKSYIETLKDINKDPKTLRVYISFKIESSKKYKACIPYESTQYLPNSCR